MRGEAPTTEAELRAALVRAGAKISSDAIKKAIAQWPGRLDAVIAAEGGGFEASR